LEDGYALVGGIGEKSLRAILDLALRIAERCPASEQAPIRKLVGDLSSMLNALCELRAAGQGASPQAQSIARSIDSQLKQLIARLHSALAALEREGGHQPLRQTLTGRMEQAMQWLGNPGLHDRNVALAAIRSIVEDALRIASRCSPSLADEIRRMCNEVRQQAQLLDDLCARGLSYSPQALSVAKQLGQNLQKLQQLVQKALLERVVNDLFDIHTPLKQFTEAVLAPLGKSAPLPFHPSSRVHTV
jgi:vinculin